MEWYNMVRIVVKRAFDDVISRVVLTKALHEYADAIEKGIFCPGPTAEFEASNGCLITAIPYSIEV